jgi:hypothetical protein
MPVTLRCPNQACGKSYDFSERHFGKQVRCKYCGATFAVPAPTVGPGAEAVVGTIDANARRTLRPSTPGARTPVAAGFQPPAGQPSQVGRYEVRARLGAGAFGTVYRAYDPQLDREVALKVPLPGMMNSPKAVERFLREARAAARLRHPCIVPLFDAGRDGDTLYLASAFIEGQPLSQAIGDGQLDFRAAAQIVRGLAEALAYAHRLGIVHRDVKPANVMLDDKGTPHLMDFGLAHRQDDSARLTQDGALFGTPAYMAPEMAGGQKGEPLPASDQYSLGVVLYELLCGKTPFSGPPQIVLYNVMHTDPQPPGQIKPGLPADLETICLKALAREPSARYETCQHLADDLRRWLDDEPIKAWKLGPAQRALRWCRQEPALAITAAVALLCLLAVAVVSSVLTAKLGASALREPEARDSGGGERGNCAQRSRQRPD